MSSNVLDMGLIVDKLKDRRKIFVSEADFQLELAWTIKENYPNAKIRLEYCPTFDFNMHIDILVIIDNKWYPIELKYKTKGCKKIVDDEIFYLKNHGAKDVNSYLYLKDIMRIERIRDNVKDFDTGYTMFITNDLSYANKPIKENCVYKQFSLENKIVKKGTMFWEKTASKGTMKNCEDPIVLKDSYNIDWKPYSKLDNDNNGTFIYVINRIKNI